MRVFLRYVNNECSVKTRFEAGFVCLLKLKGDGFGSGLKSNIERFYGASGEGLFRGGIG
jgi:hypothetical protein